MDEEDDSGLVVDFDDGLFEPTRERESGGHIGPAEREAKRHNFWLEKRRNQRERVVSISFFVFYLIK